MLTSTCRDQCIENYTENDWFGWPTLTVSRDNRITTRVKCQCWIYNNVASVFVWYKFKTNTEFKVLFIFTWLTITTHSCFWRSTYLSTNHTVIYTFSFATPLISSTSSGTITHALGSPRELFRFLWPTTVSCKINLGIFLTRNYFCPWRIFMQFKETIFCTYDFTYKPTTLYRMCVDIRLFC